MIPRFESVDPVGDQTVPDELLGCWRRNWIRFGDDGELETDVSVIWLQTASGMGDLRLDPKQQIEENDSSCGITVVEPTTPMVTADWQDGPTGFAQQPVSNFPEQGWLTWDTPTIMRELAPSGAYVEEWERLPGSDGAIVHLTADAAPTRTNLYIAGQHYFLAIEADSGVAGDTLHEFSYGQLAPHDEVIIAQLSTIEAAVGEPLKIDFDWTVISARHRCGVGTSGGAC